jgi:hypothetical protein
MSIVRVRSAQESALELIQRKYPEYHPLVALATMAHKPEVQADARLEADIHKAILPYVAPKLSSVEVKTANPDDRRVIVSLFESRELEDGRIVQTEVPLVTEVSELVQLD